MAFELDLKFTERLYLSDVSRQSVVRASTVYSKASLNLVVFAKGFWCCSYELGAHA